MGAVLKLSPVPVVSEVRRSVLVAGALHRSSLLNGVKLVNTSVSLVGSVIALLVHSRRVLLLRGSSSVLGSGSVSDSESVFSSPKNFLWKDVLGFDLSCFVGEARCFGNLAFVTTSRNYKEFPTVVCSFLIQFEPTRVLVVILVYLIGLRVVNKRRCLLKLS